MPRGGCDLWLTTVSRSNYSSRIVEIRKTAIYAQWFEALRDRQTRARMDVRVFRLANGNLGQHRVLSQGSWR